MTDTPNQTADTLPIWMRGHHAGQEAYIACRGPEAPPGSEEWRKAYVRGWVFAAIQDQAEAIND